MLGDTEGNTTTPEINVSQNKVCGTARLNLLVNLLYNVDPPDPDEIS